MDSSWTYSPGVYAGSTINVTSAPATTVALNFATGRVTVERDHLSELVAAFKDLAQAVLDLEALLRG